MEELEELSNKIHSLLSQTTDTESPIENAIYSEVLLNQLPKQDKEELEVLDEHINIPTTVQSNADSTVIDDDDTLELQLFEVGKDDQGNRIYGGVEEQLEALQNNAIIETTSEASSDDDGEDLEKQLEDVDLEKQLDELSHHNLETASSEPMPRLDPTNESSGQSSKASAVVNEGSGDADIGSGDGQLFLSNTIEASGDKSVLEVKPFTEVEEGSGRLVEGEGFMVTTNTDDISEERSGNEITHGTEESGIVLTLNLY